MPVSSLFIIPFSYDSKAQPNIAPVSMVSIPKRLQFSFALTRSFKLSTKRLDPNIASVSYSGPEVSAGK